MTLSLIPMTPASIVRRSLLGAVASLASLGVALDSALASNGWQPDTLRDISQMPVRVAKDCRWGSREDQLQTAVIAYLNRHNIPVVSNPRGQPTATPRFLISVQCTDDGLAISVRGGVIQSVQLNGRTIEAEIYDALGGYGSLGHRSEYASAERELLTGVLDRFIRDWRSVQSPNR